MRSVSFLSVSSVVALFRGARGWVGAAYYLLAGVLVGNVGAAWAPGAKFFRQSLTPSERGAAGFLKKSTTTENTEQNGVEVASLPACNGAQCRPAQASSDAQNVKQTGVRLTF